jgi:uncharacterized protein YndB with AHSA1/START domain
MRIKKTVYIARPPQDVFWAVANDPHDRRWRTELLSGERTGEVTQGVGMHAREVLSYQGRIVEACIDVSEFVPGARIGFRIHGGAKAHGALDFSAEKSGTRVSFTLTTELKGPAVMLERFVRQAVERVAESDLRRLKGVLEGTAA